MQVSGYEIKEAIRRWKFRAETIAARFDDSLFAFEGESKESPLEIAKAYREADRAVATLESMQQSYNEHTKIKVGDEEMTLALAVKLVGGAGRIEKMWRNAAKGGKSDRYSYMDTTVKQRSRDTEYSKPSLDTAKYRSEAEKAARVASSLRSGIAVGNNIKIEVSKSFEKLFEVDEQI